MITSLPRKTLAWLHQAAAAGVAKRIALRHLMERVEVLEVHDTEDASCWALVRASMHSLRERIEALEAAQRPPADHAPVATEMVTTPESAPVATDDELFDLFHQHDPLGIVLRAIYNLGRQHGAAQPPAALPPALSDALISAECALLDILEAGK